jgi:asparagine synthase (glutamine-hydrolysing)
MCGIAGVARIDGGDLDAGATQLLNRFADVLAHRGPDEREMLCDGAVGLAFTRLSLTDPESGSQPLVSDDGSLVLIANGEVYNHRELAATLPAGTRLRTGSDCEVLLYLYREHGLRFLDKVRGMFGLILWDRRAGQLVLARDRFGIKPLYYHRDRTRIVLASEIKALFADPATPRRFAWEQALTTPALAAAACFTDTPGTTWFEGVSAVPAGTILRIDLRDGRTHEHVYWRFPGEPQEVPDTVDGFVDAYRDLLLDSIRECATADAELGLFLSGGIDSAAVAAAAAQQIADLHTFTVLSPSTYRSEDAEFGHRVATKLGLPNHQVVFHVDHVPEPEEWKRLLWLLETPLCGPEIYYKYELHRYAKAARPELRGMLLGAASDEFNGGYSVDMAGGGDWGHFESHLRSIARTSQLRARPDLMPWWPAGNEGLFSDEVIRRFVGGETGDPYDQFIRWQYNKIQQYNVWHEDRTAAGSGIEARVPFLDHRLVELVAAVPAHLRPDLLWDKEILRRGMRGYVPDEVITRPKQPFFYGPGVAYTYRMMSRMLERHGAALIEEAMAAPEAATFIRADGLREYLRRLTDDPSGPHVELALRVVNLGLLAGMVADVPPPTRDTPAGPVPRSVPVTDWEAQRVDLERTIGLRPDLDVTAVPRLADDVLLLTHPADAGRWFLAIDGTIEYVLDDDTPAYRDFLVRVDGTTTLAVILDDMGCTLDTLYPTVSDLIERRVVALA